MSIKYNPYGWEIRPNKNRELMEMQGGLEKHYRYILQAILRLYSCVEGLGLSPDVIEEKWDEIVLNQWDLNDAVAEATNLRREIELLEEELYE